MRLLTFSVLAIIALSACQTDEVVKPNILFILADDMGWQDTSVPFHEKKTVFNERYFTPSLQRLADEGLIATQAYSCAVCSPTRVSLMTGQNQARHGVTQWTYLSGSEPSSDLPHPDFFPSEWNWNGLQPNSELNNSASGNLLTQLLRQVGYRTMHFGKGHFGAAGTAGADPKNLGFDVRIGGRDAGGCGSYWGTKNFGAKAHPDGPWRAWDLDKYFGKDIHLTEALTLEAKEAIRQSVKDEQPFFCYFAHYAPHTPIEPDERFAQKYRDAGLDEPEAAYASLIEGMDKSVGDLLNLLDELKISERTLVIFMSDNGGLSHDRRSMSPPHTHNAPLSSGKGSHREGGIRVPLLVRWPGQIVSASQTDIPIMIYDWYPTILDIAQIQLSASFDGVSLLPLFQNKHNNSFDRSLIWHFPNLWGPLHFTEPVKGPGMGPSSTIRKGNWKLIYYYSNNYVELFDLSNDISEENNLAESNFELARALITELSEFLIECDAPMLINKESGKKVPYPSTALKMK